MCSMDDTYLVVSAGESIYSIHSEATLYVNDIIIYITRHVPSLGLANPDSM